MLSLFEIEQKVKKLTSKIHVPARAIPTYGGLSKDDGTPHIEVGEFAYYYICSDHGVKSVDKETSDLDTLLYWIIKDITWSAALDYATAHRDPKRKFREVLFEHQLSLLEIINRDWKEQVKKETDQILKASPS